MGDYTLTTTVPTDLATTREAVIAALGEDDAIERVTMPFVRLDPARGGNAHSGLGLAIVHRIVGDHGGTIDVDDGLDGGAAFVVALPRTGPPEEITASLSDTNLPLGRADATSPDGPSEPNP